MAQNMAKPMAENKMRSKLKFSLGIAVFFGMFR